MSRTINYTKFKPKKQLTLTQKKKCLILFYKLSELKYCPSLIYGDLSTTNALILKLGITDEDMDCFRLELGRRMREKSLMILAGQTALKGFLFETNEAI